MKTVRSETILVTKILFIEILFIDLTKKRVGGILKERDDGVYDYFIHTANG